jgi:pimeloyl-ACP methyl ester carboxylesterase
MAHGLGAQKDFGLDEYGQKFSAAGFAVLAFDYRTFGGSTGEPRHWVSPKRHLEDWKSAIEFVKSNLTDRVDEDKIILWGSSFGGGHAIVTAAELGGQVAGVIAQVRTLGFKTTSNLLQYARFILLVFKARNRHDSTLNQ